MNVFPRRKRKTWDARNRRATQERGKGNSWGRMTGDLSMTAVLKLSEGSCPCQSRSAGTMGDFLGKTKLSEQLIYPNLLKDDLYKWLRI